MLEVSSTAQSGEDVIDFNRKSIHPIHLYYIYVFGVLLAPQVLLE